MLRCLLGRSFISNKVPHIKSQPRKRVVDSHGIHSTSALKNCFLWTGTKRLKQNPLRRLTVTTSVKGYAFFLLHSEWVTTLLLVDGLQFVLRWLFNVSFRVANEVYLATRHVYAHEYGISLNASWCLQLFTLESARHWLFSLTLNICPQMLFKMLLFHKMAVEWFHNTSSKSTMLYSELALTDGAPTQERNCVGYLRHLCVPESTVNALCV